MILKEKLKAIERAVISPQKGQYFGPRQVYNLILVRWENSEAYHK
jgi:hypothetical protein